MEPEQQVSRKPTKTWACLQMGGSAIALSVPGSNTERGRAVAGGEMCVAMQGGEGFY